MNDEQQEISALKPAMAPLRRPVFRALWLALIISGLGSWMHDVGAGWLMATLAPEPVMVSMVQAATLLPVFFLTLPAGALADIVNRRRFLITAQLWMMASAGTLGALTLLGLTNEWILLALTLSMGCGTAMMMPAFSALIPDLVPRAELTAAVTLNSIAFNVTRALGPAVAGTILAVSGPGIVFVVNAISFTAVIWVISRWRDKQPASSLPSERFVGSMRTGLRYARRATELHVVISRGVALFIAMSAPIAFLPLVVKTELQTGPQTYGLLFGCIGAGAVATGLVLPGLRLRYSADKVILLGSFGVVAASVALALIRNVPLLCGAMLLLGASWISAQSTLQVTAQLALPGWVRARGLAIFIASFTGVMALGAVGWGKVADLTSLSTALLISAGAGALGTLLTAGMSLEKISDRDLTPAEPIHEPRLTPGAGDADRGPVLVNVHYEIEPGDADDFVAAMQEVRRVRLRNGSSAWGLFQDWRDERRFTEIFLDQSWLDHLRQSQRITREDRRLVDRARSFHRGTRPPTVTHHVAPRRPQRR
ncbi:MAG: MFS transporter [Gammaproteobacteria bacterium]|nr:MFS transporter [Gammaproteobacteria bacterium]